MPGSNQVELSGALLSNSSWRDTSLHELGHVYDFKDKSYKSDSFFKEVAPAGNCSSNYLGCVGPFSTKFRSTSILYRIVNLLFKPRYTGVYIPNKPPTDYSFTGSIEDFADSYRIYVLDKTGYQKGDLNTTRMEIFDGYFGK